MIALSKLSETGTTITLGWTPPTGVGCYAFYAAGQLVAQGGPRLKDGSARTSVRFSKTSPGPPFVVAALVRANASFLAESGQYPTKATYPSSSLYPCEAQP